MFSLDRSSPPSPLLEALTEYAVISLDESGRIVGWNSGAERTFGHRAEAAIGQSLAFLVDAGDSGAASSERNLQAARDGGHVLEEGWYVRADGSRFFGSGMLGVITEPEGRVTGFVKLLHDDTERKTREDALLQSRDAALAKEKLVRKFIHDLRTPMSAVTLWTTLIAESEDMSPEQLSEALSAIHRSAEELQALVEQLAVSRMA